HIQFISGLITNIDDYIVFYNYRRFHQILKILTYENMSADKFWIMSGSIFGFFWYKRP
ncbi:hypothetical protein AZO1586I_1929, partial [Bathymodiolus thermophilus thioautotrophic gill symbiont]